MGRGHRILMVNSWWLFVLRRKHPSCSVHIGSVDSSSTGDSSSHLAKLLVLRMVYIFSWNNLVAVKAAYWGWEEILEAWKPPSGLFHIPIFWWHKTGSWSVAPVCWLCSTAACIYDGGTVLYVGLSSQSVDYIELLPVYMMVVQYCMLVCRASLLTI